MIPMPKRPWPIWAVGWAALLTCPLIALTHATEASRGGDGGAWMIGLLGLSAMVGMPLVFFATYFAVEGYDPRCGLLVWRGDRPVRSIVLTILFGLPAVALIVNLLAGLDFGRPWYEWLWVPWQMLVIAWLLLVRAAGINRSRDPVDPKIFV